MSFGEESFVVVDRVLLCMCVGFLELLRTFFFFLIEGVFTLYFLKRCFAT